MSAEIELSWGESVLVSETVGPGKRFVVGEASSADFVAPVETHVIRCDADGGVQVEVCDVARPLALSGHECIALGPLTLRVSRASSERERFASTTWLFDLGGVALIALYTGIVSSVSLAWFPPRATPETLELQRLPRHAFGFSIEREEDGEPSRLPVQRPATPTSEVRKAIFAETRAKAWSRHPLFDGRRVTKNEADGRRGGTGARAKGEEGAIGALYAPPLDGTWAMKDRERVRVAKERTPQKSWEFSQANPETASSEELEAEWGEEPDGSGRDDVDVFGNMFEDEPVDPPGRGLGVLGDRRGGGGEAKRLGTGQRDLGHGDATRHHDGHGVPDAATFRRDVGRAAHTPRAPSSRTEVAPVVIERVLARARGHFRACGARGESVTFEVGLDGAARNASTTNACVTRVLSGLEFLPAGKVVTRARGRVGL